MKQTTLVTRILVDAHVAAELISPTLDAIDHGLAGWPTSTPGASPPQANPSVECHHPECTNTKPCPEHSPVVTLTQTERNAGRRDPALADLELLTKDLHIVAHRIARIARICQRWGLAGVDQATVTAKLQAIDSEIWCRNCAPLGFKNPKAKKQTECDFCWRFRNDTGVPASKQLLDIHASGRKVTSADVNRDLTRRYGPDWRRQLKKRKGRAA